VVARARITTDWLPLPDETLRDLGWGEGDIVEIEVADGVLIATRIEVAQKPIKDRSITR